MTIDLAVAIFVSIGLLWGLWRGMIRQLAALVGWISASLAVWFGAPPLARSLEPFLGGAYSLRWALSALVLGIVARVGGELLFSLVARGFFDRLLSKRTREGELESGRTRREVWDRLFGSVLGAAKAMIVVWVVLSFAAILIAGLREFGVQPPVANARTYEFARQHNAVLLLFSPRVEKLVVALRDLPASSGERPEEGEVGDGEGEQIHPTSALERLADDPNVAKVVEEPGLLESLRKGDLSALLDSESVRNLMSQPGALERLGAAFDEVLGAAGGMTNALRGGA